MKIPLSEAILLGQPLTPDVDPHNWSYCALGMGLAAIGKRTGQTGVDCSAEIEAWPWTMDYFLVPEELHEYIRLRWPVHFQMFGNQRIQPARVIISWYFHMVCERRHTLEYLVDWVVANEPKELVIEPEPVSELEEVNA